MRLGDTPVPIPNTTVKIQTADGTALETMWESRWVPDSLKKNRVKFLKIKQIQIFGTRYDRSVPVRFLSEFIRSVSTHISREVLLR